MAKLKEIFALLAVTLMAWAGYGAYREKQGKDKAAAKSNEEALDKIREAKKRNEEIDSMSDDDLADELRKS